MNIRVKCEVTIGSGARVELTEGQQAAVTDYVTKLLLGESEAKPKRRALGMHRKHYTPEEESWMEEYVISGAETIPESPKKRKKMVKQFARETGRKESAIRKRIRDIRRDLINRKVLEAPKDPDAIALPL